MASEGENDKSAKDLRSFKNFVSLGFYNMSWVGTKQLYTRRSTMRSRFV